MKRREFLKILGAAPVVIALPAIAKSKLIEDEIGSVSEFRNYDSEWIDNSHADWVNIDEYASPINEKLIEGLRREAKTFTEMNRELLILGRDKMVYRR